jgi:branched-subunit amino acid transport protein
MSSVSPTVVWALIIGMAVINFAERFVPMALVSRLELPRPVLRWLSYVPIAVMGSLFATQVLMPNGTFLTPWSSPWVWAALLTAAVYYKTRSFLGATVAGMAGFVVLSRLLGA